MTSINWLEFMPLGHAIGWTVVHSIWQIILIGLVLRLLLFFVPQQQPNTRYSLLLGGLLLALIWAGHTFSVEWSHSQITAVGTQKTERTPTVLVSPPPDRIGVRATTPLASQADAKTSHLLLKPLEVINSRLYPYIPFIAITWYLGVLLLFGYTIFGFFKLNHLRTREVVVPSPEWLLRFGKLKRQMGVLRNIQFSLSGMVQEPITFHHFKPVVLAPISIFSGLTTEQIEILLLHELAHIRRYDFLINIFQSLVEVLFFYHPTVWWISGKIREEREHCCDDLVLKAHNNPMLYAEALTQLQIFHHPLKTKLVMSAKGRKSTFSKRIFRLFGQYDQKPSIVKSSLLGLLLLISLFAQAFISFPGIMEDRPELEVAQIQLELPKPEVLPIDKGNTFVLKSDLEVSESGANAKDLKNALLVEEAPISSLNDPIMTKSELELLPHLPSAGLESRLIAYESYDHQEVMELIEKNMISIREALRDKNQEKEGIENAPERSTGRDDLCKELLSAVKSNDVATVKKLLKTVNPNCTYYGQGEPRSPLVAAARKGYLEIGQLLIEAKADLEFHARGDETPLMAAARNGHLDFVQFLVKQDANVNKKVSGDGTALLVAARQGHLDVLNYLIAQKANVNAAVSGDGTALICAARSGHYEVAKVLLENGADPYQVSSGDEYAMYHARMNKDKRMIALLKQYEEER